MGKLGNERSAVQNTLIEYAKQQNWDYLTPKEAEELRNGTSGLIFREIFGKQLKKFNYFVDQTIIEDKIKALERLPTVKEGNLKAWEYLRGLKTVFLESENREKNLKIIDEEEKNNVYHVTDEFSYYNGTKKNRYDVVFLINGIPVFFVEAKAVAKFCSKSFDRESIIADALDQVRRYHNETPEAMTLFQVFTVTNIIHFLYSATWNLEAKSVFNWKTESKTQIYEDVVKSFFDRQRVTDVLLKFIFFTRQDDELVKIILRPHQMRAVDRIVERAASTKKRGLIWHTQGSGKTYTMIVAAQRILENPIFQNPTVIMLVDRNELETQLFGNLTSVGIEHIKVVESKRHLRRLLREDCRGLIVSLIHKFNSIPEKINERENIFVLVDEAHRTTGGDLGNYLMGAVPNASFIGFTGTPIDKTVQGKGTFKVFGIDDPPHGYLDKYSIGESIEDKTTVCLHYTLAPNDLKPDKQVLDAEFLKLAESQGISDIEKLNKVLDKAVTLKNMLKNQKRMENVASFIAKHFLEYIEPMGYKAFLVAVDREACAIYKKELDKYLPEDYSLVVYSPSPNDGPDLKEYYLSKEKEKLARKAFRNPDKKPKILIVTEKLLTGFDAPILYCMYLDKPMRDHVLLQAIARVNRPYQDATGRKKTSGFVLDFVGIFDNLEAALEFNSTDISGIVEDLEILKERFSELMTKARNEYLSLIVGKSQDKAVEVVLEFFRDEEPRHTFFEFFSELSSIYEILSPDAFLRPFIGDFDTLARMYNILLEAYGSGIIVDREFTRKTAKLVRENTQSGPIKSTLEVYEINDETIKKLQEDNSSDTEKVFNLLRSIGIAINREVNSSPYLHSIGEKAAIISTLYQQRQIDTQEALDKAKEIVNEINQANLEKIQKQLPSEIFTIYWILKQEEINNPEEIASSMVSIFEQYPYWYTNDEYKRKLKQEMLKVFTKSEIEVKQAVQITKKIIKILKKAKE